MRGLAGLLRGGGLVSERGRQREGTGLGQSQLTGKGVETRGELGKRPEGGRGQWWQGFGGEVGVLFPWLWGTVWPEGFARSCPRVTRPLKDRSGETGWGKKGWNGDESA